MLKSTLRERKSKMSWDYAELSHMAKEFGGPERFVNAVNYDGVVQGRWQIIIPELIIGGLTVLGIVGKRHYDKHKAQEAAANPLPTDQLCSEATADLSVVETEPAEEPTRAETQKAEKIIDRVRRRFMKS